MAITIKKIRAIEGLVITAILLLSTSAFAGEVLEFSCNSCGFVSNAVDKGCGLPGRPNHNSCQQVVYCGNCKNFTNVPITTSSYETAVSPIGEEDFLGAKRKYYHCPKCGGKAFKYEGPTCPICLKNTLKAERVGVWD